MTINALQAAQGYAAAKQKTGASQDAENPLARAAKDFGATLNEADTTATAAMTGGADPHALVEALANSQLAVETAVTVRDRVVEAYQEILRMPV
ncbi:MAG: flagellar hook-basal body complex protein FliE [Pseudomonadota bacterium]